MKASKIEKAQKICLSIAIIIAILLAIELIICKATENHQYSVECYADPIDGLVRASDGEAFDNDLNIPNGEWVMVTFGDHGTPNYVYDDFTISYTTEY